MTKMSSFDVVRPDSGWWRESELDDDTARAALFLLLDDYDDYVLRQKGKGRCDHLSDTEIALPLWEIELQDASQNLKDRQMALSLSSAILSDQLFLMRTQQEERIAEADRALATSLDVESLEEIGDIVQEEQVSQRSYNIHTEAICEITDSLAELSIGKETTSGFGPSSSGLDRSSLCVSCLESPKTAPSFAPLCGHIYCDECLRKIFLASTRDEELYPPRCCGNVFPPDIALRLLSYKELALFSTEGVEFSCVNRVYCGDPGCSTFIPPWMIEEDVATCPTCSATTHSVCKALGLPGHDCPRDEALQQLLQLGDAENWKRWSQCRTMVELNQGCNHITCR